MSRITAARRSKSFAPAHFNAFIKKERPSWTAQYALPTQDEENHSVDYTNKHRKMGNRATDLARLRDESTNLQARIERFKVVAHEAAAKAQMINSGALTLRARHAPSISAITRPPPRHRACWPSSVSYRCTSTSAQRARRQLSPVVAPPAPPTPSPHPASLTKTESKHTLSLGDFLATIPGEHRANTLRKRKAAPPASPPARGEEEESVAKEEAEAILSSPVLKRRLQDALLAQIEADRETTSVTISITISSTSAAGETDSSRPEETASEANEEEGEEEEVVVAAVEEVVVLERNTRAHKSVDKHVDEGMLKRKDIVVRKKKKADLRDEEEEDDEDEDEAKRKGKKRKTASSFLASIIHPKKKMKKSKRARKERECVADEAKANEKKVNMAAAIIEQEKHDQRVAYIKRKIEERYGVVRREAKRSGKRVRIQEPNAAVVAVPQPPSSEGKQTGEAREKVVCNETTSAVEGGGRRRRAVTVEEVTSEMASAIAGARQPLIKQRGVILLDKENLGNVADVGETKKEMVTKNNKTKTDTDTDDTKKRKTKKATRNISSSSASLTSSSASASSSGSAILVSSAGGRGVDVPRRPLQPRN